MTPTSAHADNPLYSFLSGGGEMGELTRNFDWSQTSAGPISSWPQSLRTTVSIILHSRFPMFLFWGSDQLCFYNDAYRPSLGNTGKHPTALGQKGAECWPEIWPFIKPQIDQVLAGGEATWYEDQLLPIYRNGKMEDVYWTFSYSPAYDETGGVGGVFVTCTETTGKVKSAEQQKISDERFQNLIRESSAGIVVLIGEEMKVEIVNEAYGKLIDLKPADLLGLPLFDVIPDAKEAFYPLLLNVLYTGEPIYLYDTPYMVRVDGVEINGYLNVVYQAYREVDGKITGVMAFVQDVTESVEAKKALEQREEEMSFAMEAGSLGTWEFIPATRAFKANDRLKNWFGHDPDTEMSSEFALSVVVPEDRERVYNAIQKAMDHNSGGTYDIEYTIRNMMTATECIVRAVGKTVFDENNKPLRFSGTVQDISEQVRTRRKISESENELRFAIEASELATFDLDPENDIFKGNARLKEWFGISAESDIELSVALQVISERDRALVVAAIQRAFDYSSGGLYDIEYTIIHPATGSERIVRAKGQASFNDQKKAIRFNGTLMDITGHVQARRRITESESELRFAIDASDLGTFDLNPATNKFKGNDRLKEWFGLLPHEEIELSLALAVIADRDRPQVVAAINRALEYSSGGYYDIEYTLINPITGVERIVRAKGQASFDEQQQPYRFNGTVQDITGRVLAQRNIKEQNDYLENALGIADLGTYKIDMISSTGHANETLQRIFDMEGDTGDMSSFFSRLHPDDEQMVRQAMAETFTSADKNRHDISYRIILKNGNVRYIHSVGISTTTADGRPESMSGIIQDVTEDVIAQQVIADSEQNLKNIIEQSPVGMVLFRGPRFTVEVANEKILEHWGRTLQESVGRPLLEVLPEIREQGFEKLLLNVYKTGESYRASDVPIMLVRSGQDEMRYVTFTFEAYREADGTITGVMAIANDVTSEVLAKKQVEESELFASRIIDNSVMAQCIWSGYDMTFTMVNEKMLEIFGRDRSIIGMKYMDAIPELRGTPLMDRLRHVLATGETFRQPEEEFTLRRRDGTTYTGYYTYTYQVLTNTYNENYAVLCTCMEVTDQVRARQEIAYSEARFRDVVLQAPMATCLFVGRDMVVEIANDIMLGYWGRDRSVLGLPLRQAVPELDGQPFHDILDQVYTTGQAYEGEATPVILARDGVMGTYYFTFTYQPVRNAAGEVYAIIDSAIDVTAQTVARQQIDDAQAEVRQTAESLQLALEAGRMGTFEVVIATNEVIANAQCRELFGMPADGTLGYSRMMSAVHPEDIPMLEVNKKHAIENKGDYNAEHRVILPDGSIRWIRAAGKLIFDDKNTLEKIVGITVDITAQRVYAQEMEESEKRFRTLAESLPQLVWMTDNAGNYAYASGKWLQYSGIDPYGPGAWDAVLHPDDREAVVKHWTHSITTGGTYRIEVRLRNKSGEYRWHYGQGEPINDEQGHVVSWIGAFTDIHEQKTVSQRLENLVKERTRALQRSNEDLMQFAHVTSHDLKEPVRKIKLFTTRIDDEYGSLLPEAGRAFIGKVQHSTDRMLAMIEGILLYSTLSAADQPIETVDLNAIVQHIESDLEVVIAQKGATVMRGPLPAVEGAPVLITQLFYNIIQNSLKFARAAEPLRISISSRPFVKEDITYEEITVSDNGIGFEDTHGKRIFDTFARLNAKDQYEGTGLGLALCKKIVERHHGRISATGIPGEGATFTIWLPARQDQKII